MTLRPTLMTITLSLTAVSLTTLVACTESPADDAGQSARPAPAPITEPQVAAGEEGEPVQADDAADAAAPASPIQFTLRSTGLPTEGMWKCDPVLVDVNNDGHMDLAVHPRLGTGLRVFLGNSKGMWLDSSEGLHMSNSCGGGMAFADLNDDGHLDIALADHCRGVFVYLGDGDGGWRMVTEGLYPAGVAPNESRETMWLGAEDLVVGDVDGDGHQDIVTGGSDEGGIHVYLGDGSGERWLRMTNTGLPWKGWAMRVQLADMDGDGLLDIVAAYSLGPKVWLNDGEGAFDPASIGLPEPTIQGIYQAVAVEDFNGDGRPDMVFASWTNGLEMYLQQEDGSWQAAADPFPGLAGGASGVAVGDLDADGDPDIIVAGRLDPTTMGFVRGVHALQNNGDGQWTHMSNSGLPGTGLSATSGVTIGDINKDGLPDVVACSGLAVETAPGGLTAPALDPRVLVWTTSLSNSDAETPGTLAQESPSP